MAQQLRHSQFITTYGPGAILEGQEGPRMIPALERSQMFNGQRRPDQGFEITDQRLSQALLNNARILRLPSNAELGKPESQWSYDTSPFPRWALCVTHNILYRRTDHENMRTCPLCPPSRDVYEAARKVGREAIRFVRACVDGHLDDVDWINIIRHNTIDCRPSYLSWRGGGGALRNVRVICPNCQGEINLGIAYGREWPCSGRFPELGNDRPGCPRVSKMIQRGAANLRIAELQTALTIPPRVTNLHRILEQVAIQAVLITTFPQNKQALLTALQPLVQRGLILPSTLTQINQYNDVQIRDAVNDVVANNLPVTVQTMRIQEFEALQHAATNGWTQPSTTPGYPPQFEVLREQVRVITGPRGRRLRITPVNRLRVVMVQTGYRRLSPLNSLVDCAYQEQSGQIWYPGVELFGEGIFIDLDPRDGHNGTSSQHFPLVGAHAGIWFDAWSNPTNFDPNFRFDQREQLHPVFVWWHTIAHRIITALAIDSGYSSAAVRERVFVNIDEQTGEAGGGILLYTTQPGGDGTLGGMVALVPTFERVLASSLQYLDACSNDPLCGKEQFAIGKYNGAACYKCALVSETSCEHRNMRLDRNLLRENQP